MFFWRGRPKSEIPFSSEVFWGVHQNSEIQKPFFYWRFFGEFTQNPKSFSHRCFLGSSLKIREPFFYSAVFREFTQIENPKYVFHSRCFGVFMVNSEIFGEFTQTLKSQMRFLLGVHPKSAIQKNFPSREFFVELIQNPNSEILFSLQVSWSVHPKYWID